MKQRLWLLSLALFGVAGVAVSQRGQQQPALAACGPHDDVEVICGARSPEDFERTPDGGGIIVSEFGRGAATRAGLVLFDPETRTFEELPVRTEPRSGWGEAGCAQPAPMALTPHGLSLGARPDGVTGLYVVNHFDRESIEMLEVAEAAGGWELIWRGCLAAEIDYNDIAILPGGGFVGTRPNALGGGNGGAPAAASGNVAVWTPESGEVVLPGTESAYPNGVVVDSDGRFAYIALWRGQGAIKYDLERRERVSTIELGFMPDNLTWAENGRLLAAGIQGTGPDCSGVPCIQGFEVAEIDPETMEVRRICRSEGGPSPIGGVSVAIQRGDDVYVGSFQGDRIVRLDWRD